MMWGSIVQVMKFIHGQHKNLTRCVIFTICGPVVQGPLFLNIEQSKRIVAYTVHNFYKLHT